MSCGKQKHVNRTHGNISATQKFLFYVFLIFQVAKYSWSVVSRVYISLNAYPCSQYTLQTKSWYHVGRPIMTKWNKIHCSCKLVMTTKLSWWQMDTFTALLALCEANPPVTGGFPSQWPGTRHFDAGKSIRAIGWGIKRFQTRLRRVWNRFIPITWVAGIDLPL